MPASRLPAASEAPEGGSLALRRLARALPEPRCELDHANPWQLLIATILSAQSTDRTVNRVTPALFERYPTPRALGEAEPAELEALIRPTGFFRNKAKAIAASSRRLVERHGGEVPRTLDALVELPGVARKTANVVLGVAYGIPSGIVVDTHAGRVARRLGWTAEKDPARIERELCAWVPRRSWIALSHRLVLHGRYVCTSRAPACEHCPLAELCPSAARAAQGALAARCRWERERVLARGERGDAL